MLLRIYSNHFLHNHTGKVVPRVFLHAENFIAFDQIHIYNIIGMMIFRLFSNSFRRLTRKNSPYLLYRPHIYTYNIIGMMVRSPIFRLFANSPRRLTRPCCHL